jgi:hypothetical protein
MILKFKSIFEALHENFSRKIWNKFLENIIINYVKCLLESSRKGKPS